MQDPLDRNPSPRNAGSTESILSLPGVRADRDFPGQVTRSAAAGSGAEARPDSQEGPERVGGWREGVPAGVHLASPGGVISPSCRARGRLRAPPLPKGGRGGGTHVIARLRPGAMEIGGATMPAGDPGVRPRRPGLRWAGGLCRGAELSPPILAAGFRLRWAPWRPLVCPHDLLSLSLGSALQTLGACSGCYFFRQAIF